MEDPKYSNRLVHETSPYLLQHAHNPVDWHPWNNETLELAQKENKPLLVSIGYSACHWCHVMEKESFEDVEVANIMNDNFICIKVDREERPDVDQLYMDAVQLMTGQGGWPLNVFALPDGRPVYGGTYFPKEQWKNLCKQIAGIYQEKPDEALNYAMKLHEGLVSMNQLDKGNGKLKIQPEDVDVIFENMSHAFDTLEGGQNTVNKFPMPDIYLFLLRYYHHSKNEAALEQLRLTLSKMADGGIYDHLGGGFARYATDKLWKVPHFEKMLYDNAQLISLYSEAYQLTKNELYKKVVYETVDFVQRELMSDEYGFYAALDADSEGVEGKFYIWKEKEIDAILGDDAPLFKDYYQVGKNGYWEHGNNILLVNDEPEKFLEKYDLSRKEFDQRISEARDKLFKIREQRVHPALDDKILTAWNALMLKALNDAYKVFNEDAFLKLAEQNYNFLMTRCYKDNQLYRNYKNGKASIPAFLEDYALLIKALISYYENTFKPDVLENAEMLTKYVIAHFYDPLSGFFYFSDRENTKLIANKIDVSDNVIASPNSVMAHNLFLMSGYTDHPGYKTMAEEMLISMFEKLSTHPLFHANWAMLLLNFVYPWYEVVFTGTKAHALRLEFETKYLPNKSIAGTCEEADQPDLIKNRYVPDKNLIYVCVNNTCQLPVEKVEEAWERVAGY